MSVEIVKNDGIWTLFAGRSVLSVCGETGRLTSLMVNGKAEVDLWEGISGGFRVFDGEDKRTFSNLNDGSPSLLLISADATKKDETPVLNLNFQAENGAFALKVSLTPEEKAFSIQAAVIRLQGDDRTTSFSAVLPWPATLFPYSGTWRVWAANHRFPMRIYDFNEMQLEYGGIDSGIMLPATTIYDTESDIGLTLAKPFSLTVPRLRFKLDRNSRYLEAEFSMMRMRDGGGAVAGLEIYAHEGDWRPGLGEMYRRYEEYFLPPHREAYDLEGPMLGGRVYQEADVIERFKREAGVLWEEVYSYFPHFGDYFSETEPWVADRTEDKTPLTYERVSRHLNDLHDNDIAGLLYWQAQGDAQSAFAAENFPESVIRQENGKPIGIEFYGVLQMNGDPELPFGRHLLDQARKLLDKFPAAGGFFVDQACYNWIDFAHDDGLTMIDNKPAYMSIMGYERTLGKLSAVLAERGKVAFGNGPGSIEVQRYLDGTMAETHAWVMGQLQYFALAKPMVCLVYGETRYEVERSLQLCVKHAVFPGVFCLPKVEYGDLYKKYLPLIQQLKGRRWVFSPCPLTLPEGMEGDIFLLPDGNYAVTMVSGRRSVLEACPDNADGYAPVKVRLPGVTVKGIRLVTVDRPEGIPLDVSHTGAQEKTEYNPLFAGKEVAAANGTGEMTVYVPCYVPAAVMILEV